MADAEEPTRDEPAGDREQPQSRPLRQLRTEAALGLEVARLFGVSPRLLMEPAAPPVGSADRAFGDSKAQ